MHTGTDRYCNLIILISLKVKPGSKAEVLTMHSNGLLFKSHLIHS